MPCAKDIEEIIIEVLRGGAKSPKELRETTQQVMKNNKINHSDSNYFYHLAKLEKQGKIERIYKAYKLAKIDENADPVEVNKIINYLNTENDTDILQLYSESFSRLLETKRGANNPQVLPFMGKYSRTLNSRHQNLEKLCQGAYVLLAYEKRKRKTEDKKMVAKISQYAETVERLVGESSDNEFIGEVLYFLAEIGDRKAVDIVFSLIQTLPKDRYSCLKEHIADRLFTSNWTLFENNKELIMDKV
jgi:uncharacterized protein (DUF2164 family)